mmetsp:Transcript_36855/g.101680  ORF Transcript_36855/g.101680 Transcript_36855/m.101680 type:complete len:158 (+) Transcript_36855:58-531(+)
MQATWRPPLAPYAGLQCTDRRDHPGAVVMAEAEEKKAMLAAAKKELMELDNEIGKHEKSLGADEDTADEAEADDDDGMGEKLAGWEKRKAKYTSYIDKGKIEKLEKACEKQKAKLEKAKAKGKSEAYIAYKAAKVEWTEKAIKAAKIMKGLMDAGLA